MEEEYNGIFVYSLKTILSGYLTLYSSRYCNTGRTREHSLIKVCASWFEWSGPLSCRHHNSTPLLSPPLFPVSQDQWLNVTRGKQCTFTSLHLTAVVTSRMKILHKCIWRVYTNTTLACCWCAHRKISVQLCLLLHFRCVRAVVSSTKHLTWFHFSN